MSKHTPEPWYVVSENGKAKGVRNTGGYICFMKEVPRWTGQPERYEKELDEAEANARLIAACPTMYEYIAQRAHDGCENAIEIMSAIAKATFTGNGPSEFDPIPKSLDQGSHPDDT